MYSHKQSGFTLVELAIVLVIVGLVTGLILITKDLIYASKVRSVTTDVQAYASATVTFRDKYFALPGDITNATGYWGDHSECPDATITDGDPGVCNGNGNGQISYSGGGGASSYNEGFMFWSHLALSGLIKGEYTGLAGPGFSSGHGVIGTNIPSSKIKQGGWSVTYAKLNPGSAGTNFALDYGNHFVFGAESSCCQAELKVITPEDAWNIDLKMDDGLPAYGSVIGIFPFNECSAADSGVSADSTDANYDASYRIQDSSKMCALRFRNMF